MTTKITSKVALCYAVAAINDAETLLDNDFSKEEVIEKLKAMYDALDKKSNAPKKPSKAEEKRGNFKPMVLDALSGSNDFVTIADMQGMNEELAACSVQFISGVLRDLIKEGAIERGTVKRHAGYKLVR